jgi:hypothetical protein
VTGRTASHCLALPHTVDGWPLQVAAVPDAELSFVTVIEPLMSIEHYKTNPQVCEAKFLQHCSVDPALRAAADKAGTTFAAIKAKARTRDDVYARVKAYSATPEAAGLAVYEAHFVQAILEGFERSGLALDEKQRAELQALRDADTAVCARCIPLSPFPHCVRRSRVSAFLAAYSWCFNICTLVSPWQILHQPGGRQDRAAVQTRRSGRLPARVDCQSDRPGRRCRCHAQIPGHHPGPATLRSLRDPAPVVRSEGV